MLENTEDKIYDLIIIGGSAAAMTAGIYASRRNLNYLLISKDFGGEVATSGEVENWPGIIHTTGIELAMNFRAHLESYNPDMRDGVWVESISKTDGIFQIKAKSGDQDINFKAKAVIVATGVHPRELGVAGEQTLRGHGVSYCTVCDGPLFDGKKVAVVGGGNSALESGLMLADIASEVVVINKNSKFNGEQVLLDNLMKKQNVKIVYNAMTQSIQGDKKVSGITYSIDGISEEIEAEGVFIHIGMIPNSALVGDLAKTNKFGEIEVDDHCQTSVEGLFSAGDVTNVPFKQIVIAAGQGCTALLSAVAYINRI